VEDDDGSRRVRPDALREAGGIEQMLEDIFNRTRVEAGTGKRLIKMAKDFGEATGEWGVCLRARLAAAKVRLMTHFTTGAKTGLHIIHMPFGMKKSPSDAECLSWHMMWEDDGPFHNMVLKTFEGLDVVSFPAILQAGNPKEPVMFAVAVGVSVKEDEAEEGKAEEEDPQAMD